MNIVLGIYLIEFVGIFVCILLGYFIYDKRVNRNHGENAPDGFQPTEEINMDPVTGEKTRVYFNAETGERFYKKES